MRTSPQGMAVIRSFEGRSLKAYRDEVGVWTIGYGQTNNDAAVLGFPIKAGVTITEDQAEKLLQASLARLYEPAVDKITKGDQRALDAGVSFHYNTGAINTATWVKSWAAHMASWATQIMAWNKAGGKVLGGLTRRRGRERDIILTGDYGPEGAQTAVTDEKGRPITVAKSNGTINMSVLPAHLDGQPGMLRRGDEGPEVSDYQTDLGVQVTGIFNTETETATRTFQNMHKQLQVDGVAGPATRRALKRAEAAVPAVTKTATKAGGTGAVAVGADQGLGFHVPPGWLILGALVLVGFIGYTAWKYRDELRAMWLVKLKK